MIIYDFYCLEKKYKNYGVIFINYIVYGQILSSIIKLDENNSYDCTLFQILFHKRSPSQEFFRRTLLWPLKSSLCRLRRMLWLKEISTPDFLTPSFNPRPFNPGLSNPKSGVKKCRVGKCMFKRSGVERSGVEKSGVEIS